MDFLDTLLWPLRWVIEAVLVGGHWLLTQVGLGDLGGWTWILSIFLLVIIVRSAMIPLTVRQLKSMRGMMELQPELKRIQDKYKGKRDQFSQQAMQQETMALYKEHGSSPLSGCWPMLIQMPIFFALFRVLNTANSNQAGVGAMNLELAHSFSSSEIFGAPLSATLMDNGGNTSVIITAILIIVLMVSTQFFTQFQITAQNISPAAKESPMFKQQQMMMYLLPLVMAVSGLMFPIGVMSYWALSNLWTMGQQWVTIRQMPTPGSDAAKKREERLRRQGKWETSADNPANQKKKKGAPVEEIVEKPQGQREQPMSKQRAKKKKKKK
ncbi:membrane protein insertase YidC [Gulosibacter molinativorax]|uniref:Membrane protein insertase YidC n=1 Tax=Gulosibacter molinativorax TaxID=256821 RepID=A0ABT7CA74_9MICO|nr:membrane protein insertase YidC [Gulosibacter molinativorax]MDJ1371699.1 membrane protein insertase YidC [Gulosibacter molinativorax]QUY63120.1 Preprotein translocase, YidC subunit [Gulosibacter molinativorax]